jgi:hypothetical protein
MRIQPPGNRLTTAGSHLAGTANLDPEISGQRHPLPGRLLRPVRPATSPSGSSHQREPRAWRISSALATASATRTSWFTLPLSLRRYHRVLPVACLGQRHRIGILRAAARMGGAIADRTDSAIWRTSGCIFNARSQMFPDLEPALTAASEHTGQRMACELPMHSVRRDRPTLLSLRQKWRMGYDHSRRAAWWSVRAARGWQSGCPRRTGAEDAELVRPASRLCGLAR